MPRREPPRSQIVAHATAAGTVAAMAMTGMRAVTIRLGLLTQPPPDAVLKESAPGLLARVPIDSEAAVELAHWAYGAVAGAAFGTLSRSIRRAPLAGPAYGLLIWALFELGIAPVLGIQHAKERPVAERLAIASDHVLYGVIVASRTKAVS